MKIEITSRETIKPSSSTPSHLKHYKLSLLDQFAIPSYIRIVLFYNNIIPNQENIQKLKKSLADSLTLYYPLAGKYVKDQSFINCNDDGALFIEARFEGGDVAVVDSGIDLESLLPMGHVMSETEDEILMAVQATTFSNGITVGISVTHKILDGTGFAAFIKCWVAHATNKEFDSPTFDASKIWLPMENPPANTQIMSANNVKQSDSGEMMTKKFLFSGMDIANLKERAKGKIIPTRVEAVMALLWRCLILTMVELRRGNNWAHLLVFPVNLRSRIVPPLEKTSFGSIIKSAMVLATPDDRDLGIDELAGRIRAASTKVDDKYGRNNELLNGVFLIHEPFRSEIFGELGGAGEILESCVVTSWCGFRLYETDFGWGRPDKVRCEPNVRNKNLGLLTDAKDGVGIEVLLTLGLEEMNHLSHIFPHLV